MPSFGRKSSENLNQCHPDLRRLFQEVVVKMDCSITCGIRRREDQEKAFDAGKSSKRWPDSKHNVEIESELSMAVDAPPYPINWNDLPRFYMFVGYVKRVADELGVRIRCGADWDMDGYTEDQRFHDLPHFELMEGE